MERWAVAHFPSQSAIFLPSGSRGASGDGKWDGTVGNQSFNNKFELSFRRCVLKGRENRVENKGVLLARYRCVYDTHL